MKKKIVKALGIIFVTAMMSPAFVYAEKNNCALFAQAAEVAMQSHQAGIPLSQVMEGTDGNKALRELIIMAYERPRYSSKKFQQEEVSRFRDQIHVECLRHFQGE